MTLWLVDQRAKRSRPPIKHFPPQAPNLDPYRNAALDVAAEVGRSAGTDVGYAERIVTRRLAEDDFDIVLSATPGGRSAAIARIAFEVRNHVPTEDDSRSLATLVRIALLAQIEAVWWGRWPGYLTDADVCDSADLVDLDAMEQAGQLRFRYRHQATTFLARAARSAERRTLPGRTPRTAGLSVARSRPQTVAWLNQLAEEFALRAPYGTPPLWVTSVTRSIAHQKHLKSLGYIAVLPSSHCIGYAADIEMAWYRRFHAHRLLRGLLLDRQRANEVNVIDEGQVWNVCLRPEIVHGPRPLPRAQASQPNDSEPER